MQIKLIHKNYLKKQSLYEDFLNNNIIRNIDYYSEDLVALDEIKEFPIYIATQEKGKREEMFFEAFKVIEKYYIHLDRDIITDERFWHSLLLKEFRPYILKKYPEIKSDRSLFEKIIVKRFNWENYIYKSLLIVQYVEDNINKKEKEKYYKLILDNFDVFNYMIKYSVFRNDKFIINILRIIDETNTSDILKAKIENHPNLGKDERYGRRVIFELNKIYPIITSPMMDYLDLKEIFMQILRNYLYN